MSLLQKVRTTVLAYSHDLLDKAVDLNSIPVVKQYIRDLEDAISKTRHEAAVSSASVTTQTAELTTLQTNVTNDTARAKAYLAKNDETNARATASRIHDTQQEIESLKQAVALAQQNTTALDGAVQKMENKHREMLSQLRILESKDRSAKALEQATSSLKSASAVASNDISSSVDNLAQKINARSDLAREEFNRTVTDFTPAPDPLKDAAVDEILNGLRTTAATV